MRGVRRAGSPLGIATDGSEVVIANRVDPWGAIRLRRVDDDKLIAQKIPIIEPDYNQKMSVPPRRGSTEWRCSSTFSTSPREKC